MLRRVFFITFFIVNHASAHYTRPKVPGELTCYRVHGEDAQSYDFAHMMLKLHAFLKKLVHHS